MIIEIHNLFKKLSKDTLCFLVSSISYCWSILYIFPSDEKIIKLGKLMKTLKLTIDFDESMTTGNVFIDKNNTDCKSDIFLLLYVSNILLLSFNKKICELPITETDKEKLFHNSLNILQYMKEETESELNILQAKKILQQQK